MNPQSLTPVSRVLRGCLHLLVGLLLALTAVRALTESGPTRADAWLVTLVAAVTGGVYALGPLLGRAGAARSSRTSGGSPGSGGVRTAVVGWLVALTAGWLTLLAVAQDGVWLAFPLFFVVLYLLPRPTGLLTVAGLTTAAIAGFGWHTHTLSVGTVVGPALGAAVAVVVVFGYQALYRESEQRQRLIDELTATRGELALAERSAGVSAERERLAREIHDTLAQGLSSIQLLLRAAERALPADPQTASGHVRHARVTAVENLTEARRFVRELSPSDLAGGSLPAALERLCARADASAGSDAAGPTVRFSTSGEPLPLATAVETAVLRIAQSALGNALRHAHANRVELTLSYMSDPGRPEVVLDVVDDGRGFRPEELPPPGSALDGSGFGIAAMRARAQTSQGEFVVESAPGAGTAVAVTFPALADASPGENRAADAPEGRDG